MNAHKVLITFVLFLSFTSLFSQQPSLRINEISQGSGEKEYVEFIVTGIPSTACNPQTLDLRGWIFDDNNGRFKTGSGTGIANGSMRFSTATFWQAVPVGTLILIYNSADFDNSIIPAQDLSITDGNCKLVIPISSSLFEKNSLPNQNTSTYPTTGWTTGGDWNFIGMANTNDSFQIYAADNTTIPVHAISWGNNTLNNILFFSGNASGKVFSAMNTSSTDLNLQSNWASLTVNGTNQTPGLPNSTQNAAYISYLNNNCSIPTGGISISAIGTNVSCNATCNGTATVTISGGTAPYTVLWSNNETTNTIQNLCAGTYSVTVTDNLGCDDTQTVTIGLDATFTLTTSGNKTICAGESTTISANGATTYAWIANLGTGNSITVNPTSTTTYVVTGTTNGCSVSENIVLTVNPTPAINAGNDQTVCIGETYTLNATGGDNYVWSDGYANGDSFIPAAGVHTYTVVGTLGSCFASDQVQITAIPCDFEFEIPNVFTPNDDNSNDFFVPIQQTNIIVKEMNIFNRWGNILYTSEGPSFSWNGKSKGNEEVLPGVYFYELTYLNALQELKTAQGFVHLMR
ncbi:MAG: gliding motility-associated C-terminal domain-containing protein [Crocinitomicaceae bacterium]|nr:gliding motility-associated C-terminal domain-containing protein [Crocinitomicaceae bacterium]